MKTSKNQIDLNWGSSRGSVVVDLSSNEILNYYKDHEKIHELYGGKNYYQSRSGMSGAGFLPKDPFKQILVFKGYRTTTAHLSEYYIAEHAGFKLLVPADKDRGVNYQNPVILVFDENIWFLGKQEFVSFLKKQIPPTATTSSEKVFELSYLDEDGCTSTWLYKIHNHCGLSFTKAGRPKLPYRFEEYLKAFDMLPHNLLKFEASANEMFQKLGLMESRIGLVRINYWSGMAIEKIKWPTDKVINGWRIVEDGSLAHLFRREDVYSDNPQILHLVMMKINHDEDEKIYYQYEEHCSFGWMTQPLRAVMDSGARKLLFQIYRDNNAEIFAAKRAMKMLKIYPDAICHLNSYVEVYGEEYISSLLLPAEISFAELAAREDIMELLEKEKFRNVIRRSCEGKAPRKGVTRKPRS